MNRLLERGVCIGVLKTRLGKRISIASKNFGALHALQLFFGRSKIKKGQNGILASSSIKEKLVLLLFDPILTMT